MNSTFLPSLRQIRHVFVSELTDVGGTVADTFDDGTRLYLRAILPGTQEVAPRDRVQGGVALRLLNEEVLVQPYIFRQVCSNGAIVAQALEARRLERLESPFLTPDDASVQEVLEEVRAAVRACTAREAFIGSVAQMQSASLMPIDSALDLRPLFAHLTPRIGPRTLRRIGNRFRRSDDQTLFGLMNAVTSVARDTRDPERRWRLEELGGGIPALLLPVLQPDHSAAALRA
jgi:hypothetical protein